MVLTVEKLNYYSRCNVFQTLKIIKEIKSIHPMKCPTEFLNVSDDLVRAALAFEDVARMYSINIGGASRCIK